MNTELNQLSTKIPWNKGILVAPEISALMRFR